MIEEELKKIQEKVKNDPNYLPIAFAEQRLGNLLQIERTILKDMNVEIEEIEKEVFEDAKKKYIELLSESNNTKFSLVLLIEMYKHLYAFLSFASIVNQIESKYFSRL